MAGDVHKIPSEKRYWECLGDNIHITTMAGDVQKIPSEKRYWECLGDKIDITTMAGDVQKIPLKRDIGNVWVITYTLPQWQGMSRRSLGKEILRMSG